MELPSLEAWKADVSGVIPVVFAMTKVERPKYQVFNLLTVDFVSSFRKSLRFAPSLSQRHSFFL